MSTDKNDEIDIITNDEPQVDETSPDVSQETDEDVTPDLPKSKSVEKLLAKKNAAEKEKAELAERVAQLESQAKVDQFLRQYPDAEKSLEDIQALVESGEAGSLESARKIYLASDPQLLNQLSQSKPVFWNPSSKIYKERSIKDLTDEELEQRIIEEGRQGNLY